MRAATGPVVHRPEKPARAAGTASFPLFESSPRRPNLPRLCPYLSRNAGPSPRWSNVSSIAITNSCVVFTLVFPDRHSGVTAPLHLSVARSRIRECRTASRRRFPLPEGTGRSARPESGLTRNRYDRFPPTRAARRRGGERHRLPATVLDGPIRTGCNCPPNGPRPASTTGSSVPCRLTVLAGPTSGRRPDDVGPGSRSVARAGRRKCGAVRLDPCERRCFSSLARRV